MFNLKSVLFFTISLSIIGLAQLKAQQGSTLAGADTARNPITTAVPFLSITPDARSGGMGDVGAAISPDANSIYWNPAKLAFSDKRAGFALSYNPWLTNLGINDMFLAYLTGFTKIDKLQAVAFELRYFNLGNIEFRDAAGEKILDFQPREFAFGGTYSRKLSNRLSVGVGGRFIYSNLSGDLLVAGTQESKPGIGGSADLSVYYTNKDLKINNLPATLSFGLNISNIGPKISYINRNTGDFIPTNLRLGSALTMSLDPFEKNKLTFALDFNKLMVPSPPQRDSQGNIVKGKNPRDITLISGIMGSFSDAPGGFKEELREFSISLGMEYSYNNVFFARAGHFNESKYKGNRKYYTIGAGFRYNTIGLDVAYLIPMQQNNPLAETLRFTFHLNFEDKNKTATIEGVEVN